MTQDIHLIAIMLDNEIIRNTGALLTNFDSNTYNALHNAVLFIVDTSNDSARNLYLFDLNLPRFETVLNGDILDRAGTLIHSYKHDTLVKGYLVNDPDFTYIKDQCWESLKEGIENEKELPDYSVPLYYKAKISK